MKTVSNCAHYVLLLAVAVQADVVPPPNGEVGDCWTSTRAISENELQLNSNTEDFTTTREYLLCSDTTYQIGSPETNEELDWPIMVINPNLHVICPDQSVCTLEVARAGVSAVWTPPGAQVPFTVGSQTVDSVSADGFKMTGVTVTTTQGGPAVPDSPVVIFTIEAIDVLIQGCHFRDLGQVEAIFLDYPDGALLNLSDDRLFQRVTVEDCIFERSEKTFIAADAADISTRDDWPLGSMTIRRSHFARGNETVGASIFMTGQMILEVTDSCFDDTMVSNPTTSPSIAHLLGTDNFFKNNHGEGHAWGNPELCFKPAIRITSDDPQDGCIDFDADVCALDIPASVPTLSPSVEMASNDPTTETPAPPSSMSAPSQSPLASTPTPTTNQDPTSSASNNMVELAMRTTTLLFIVAAWISQ